jgi:hypothetical protein
MGLNCPLIFRGFFIFQTFYLAKENNHDSG